MTTHLEDAYDLTGTSEGAAYNTHVLRQLNDAGATRPLVHDGPSWVSARRRGWPYLCKWERLAGTHEQAICSHPAADEGANGARRMRLSDEGDDVTTVPFSRQRRGPKPVQLVLIAQAIDEQIDAICYARERTRPSVKAALVHMRKATDILEQCLRVA